MATTRSQVSSVAPPEKDPLVNLARGFDYLTLNPGPRLRKFRARQAEPDRFTEAWKIVGEAMREALGMITRMSSIK